MPARRDKTLRLRVFVISPHLRFLSDTMKLISQLINPDSSKPADGDVPSAQLRLASINRSINVCRST